MATETQKAPANLVEKLAAVMAQVERVPKNGENKFHGYKYATEADLSDAVRSNMARFGVMLIPSVEKLEWREIQTKGGAEKVATLTVRFTVTDGATEIHFNVIGEGQDKGDKATYKAMTGATKYALLKLFLIPTGDDPETEEGEQPHTGSRAAPKNGAAKAVEAPKGPTMPPPHVTALWAKVKDAHGANAKTKFEAAAGLHFKDHPKPSHEWSVKDTEAIADLVLGPADIAF